MSYALFLEPEVHTMREKLPGHIRQRVRRLISTLANNPRPPGSHVLDVSGLHVPPGIEMYRLRLEGWRLVYAVSDTEKWVRVMGIYRRPPYNYADIPDLLDKLLDDDEP